jgi:hypothetical protein
MKITRTHICIIFFIIGFNASFAQITGGGAMENNNKDNNKSIKLDDKNSVSIQVLKFGVGFDYERLVSQSFGLGIGVGILGAELQTKLHFKPQINSSAFGLSGGTYFLTGAVFSQLFYEFRSQKHFLFSLGAGAALLDNTILPNYRISLGVYFPW